jgi:hypothetical protein
LCVRLLIITDTPNVYIFAFAGIGGTPIFNAPPEAICHDVEIPSETCELTAVDPLLIGGNSSDPENGNLTFSVTPSGPYTIGDNVLSLTVTDPGGLSSTCTATVAVNCPPVAICQDLIVSAGLSCEVASIDVASIDGGSYDPNGDSVSVTSVPGPYSLGINSVTLTVEDSFGLRDTCVATVTVSDDEELGEDGIDCDADGVIAPCDTPEAYTPTYTKANGCPVSMDVTIVGCKFCNGANKIVEKECLATTDGATMTIENSGGVGNHIIYSVSVTDSNDEHKASKACTICVETPDVGCGDRKLGKPSSRGPFKCPEGWTPEDSFQCGE